MTNINISIKKEAYDFLKSFKTQEKSFSEVILEFKENKFERRNAESLLRFAGVLKNLDWEEKEKGMGAFRESFNRRLRK